MTNDILLHKIADPYFTFRSRMHYFLSAIDKGPFRSGSILPYNPATSSQSHRSEGTEPTATSTTPKC